MRLRFCHSSGVSKHCVEYWKVHPGFLGPHCEESSSSEQHLPSLSLLRWSYLFGFVERHREGDPCASESAGDDIEPVFVRLTENRRA